MHTYIIYFGSLVFKYKKHQLTSFFFLFLFFLIARVTNQDCQNGELDREPLQSDSILSGSRSTVFENEQTMSGFHGQTREPCNTHLKHLFVKCVLFFKAEKWKSVGFQL